MYSEFRRLSPNHAATPTHERRGVCFHHSVLSFADTIALMLQPESAVSYHVVIDRDGTRCILVEDTHIAWHAGASSFRGRARCNAFLLGVSFAGDTYADPLTNDQIASALDWLRPRWRKHSWTLEAMTDHRQIAPGRKNDLNPAEWERLLGAIEGHFPDYV